MLRVNRISIIRTGYEGDKRASKHVCVQLEERYCYECHHVVVAPDPDVRGASVRGGVAADVVEIYGGGPTAGTMEKTVMTVAGETFCENAIRNCVRAAAENCLEASMDEVLAAMERPPPPGYG